MTDGGTRSMLRELEELERELSKERRRLQDRIDFVRGSGAAESERLERLEQKERELSARRRSVQRQLDSARKRPS